jgi:hypothetical protein
MEWRLERRKTYDWKIPNVHDSGRLPSGRG